LAHVQKQQQQKNPVFCLLSDLWKAELLNPKNVTGKLVKLMTLSNQQGLSKIDN
jgi:hypothetical protein